MNPENNLSKNIFSISIVFAVAFIIEYDFESFEIYDNKKATLFLILFIITLIIGMFIQKRENNKK